MARVEEHLVHAAGQEAVASINRTVDVIEPLHVRVYVQRVEGAAEVLEVHRVVLPEAVHANHAKEEGHEDVQGHDRP